MKKIIFFLVVPVLFTACTKLDETVSDKQVAGAFYATEAGINSSLATIYNSIRGDWNGVGYAGADRGWYDMNEVTTDELMLPTRDGGASWSDGGVWIKMYQHTFDAGHPFLDQTWGWLYKEVYYTNTSVDLLTNANATPAAIAEAKVARAFTYYLLMDGWGSVPLYTDNKLTAEKIPQADRKTIFNFIESELKANIDALPETVGGTFYGRFNKWAGYALLSRLYLNAEVYTGTPRWADCIAATDKIINSGKYSLVNGSDYFTLFGETCPDQEVIMAIYVNGNPSIAPRNIIGLRSLAGPEGKARFNISSWNGGCAHKNFIAKYDPADIRKAQWESGDVKVNGTTILTYDPEINDISNALTLQGSRNIKFLPVGFIDGGTTSNDIPIFRYAEILLTKAEASLRNNDGATAKTYYDLVRARAGLAASSANPSLTDIYDERGRELCWEGLRRQDMIRFGTYTQAHDFKPASPQGITRNIFPIPTSRLNANANLKQNPGY